MIGTASGSFTETEKRYATIEKEALAVVWGMEKFHYYIYEPLVSLLGNKEI